jgi:hypothetical protein
MESEMKKLTTIVLVVAVVVFGGGAALALNSFHSGFMDYPLPDSPCGFSHTETATPLVFNNSFHVLYTCGDGRQFVRDYYHVTGTGTTTTQPSTTTPPPPPPAPITCTTVNPGPAFTCVNGNWIYTG